MSRDVRKLIWAAAWFLTALDSAWRFVYTDVMSKKPNPPKSDQPKPDAKITIYSRIAPDTIEALDRICELMRPKPTRAQLIDTALAEYVERHGKARHDAGGR